jgi:hypothetical protein
LFVGDDDREDLMTVRLAMVPTKRKFHESNL